MINLPTVWGFKIHLFQYMVFTAAILFGPVAGMISGGFGSIFTAMTLGNPFIIFGNMLLGFFTGHFFKKGYGLIPSVLMAFTIQVPWLYVTDVYLVSMPSTLVFKIILALLVANIVWAFVAGKTRKKFEAALS